MKAKVEITKGWDGDEVIKETMVSDVVRPGLDIKASHWLRTNAPDPRNIKPYWTLTDKDGDVIIDYGSYTYFGRFTVLQGDTSVVKPAGHSKGNKMSKKKPYSRIENGKTLRKLAADVARGTKELGKLGAPDWFVRLTEEYNAEVMKLVKLRDFIWVKDTKDSEARISDEAAKVCPKALKLLVRQADVMTKFCGILGQRVELGWPKTPGVCECKKDEKKPTAKKAPAKKAK